ncbi:hypothetical protein ACFQW6_07355 [Nocardioides sp. GCM10028917]|uniref:hypothetical protein n=1 Tax=Nocardioides sp. GCM10028917 TaxID=3273408 RepID=UPI003618C71A
MFELLYYPLVHPPRRTLLEATLYWDSLTSLAPGPASEGWYVWEEDLRVLEGEGVYRRTHLEPMMLEHDVVLDRVMDRITEVIDHADPSTLTVPDRFAPDTRLWSGKLPSRVEEGLRERRLLVDDDRHEGALRGNPQILLASIACLAEEASMLLEEQTGNRVVPSTDNRYSHACATIPLPSTGAEVSWMVDVGQLLPIPDADTPIADVIQFRNSHTDELGRCLDASRNMLAELRQEIANPREVVMEFAQRLTAAITDLQNAGKSRFRWGVKRASWLTVATGATAVGGSAAIDVSVHATPLVLALSTVGGGIAVNLASAPTRPRDDNFTYLHQLSEVFPSALAAS